MGVSKHGFFFRDDRFWNLFSIGGGKVLNIPVSGIPPLCDNSHWNSHEFTVLGTLG